MIFFANIILSSTTEKSNIIYSKERGLEYNSSLVGDYVRIDIVHKNVVIISSNDPDSFVDFFKYYIWRFNQKRQFDIVLVEKKNNKYKLSLF